LKVSELKPGTVVWLSKQGHPTMSSFWVVAIGPAYVQFRAGAIMMEFFAERCGPDLEEITDDSQLPMKIHQYLGKDADNPRTTHVPTCHCLVCGATLDAATAMGHRSRPKPGDLTICLRCGATMKVADDLTVRAMTEEEAAEIERDPQLVEFLRRVTQKIQSMPKMN
jgi:hypothetical protein